jgi:hypothetical protein
LDALGVGGLVGHVVVVAHDGGQSGGVYAE